MKTSYKNILFISSDVEDLIPFLRQYAESVTHVTTKEAALSTSNKADLILFDFEAKNVDGVDLLRTLGMQAPKVPIVLLMDRKPIHPHNIFQRGVRCIFFKPFLFTCLSSIFANEPYPLLKEDSNNTLALMGQSAVMQNVYRMIHQVSSSNANVFIVGESGTGKELVAEAIHHASPRRHKPFIPLNCSAFPPTLLESELFGHKKGAFTGATTDYPGLAVAADGGTLFFDEICDMPIDLQPKLLRFIQSKKIRPVGSSRLKILDLRFICATNCNPLTEIKEDRFREDLYYRLNVVPISLPPLRERGSDILLLARHFLSIFAAEEKKHITKFDTQAEQIILNYKWPGNIRQLQNIIHNMVILAEGNTVTLEMVQNSLCIDTSIRESALPIQPSIRESALPIQPLKLMEKEAIFSALHHTNNDIAKAASYLEVSPATLYRKLQQYEKKT